jgi:hypothetical protein
VSYLYPFLCQIQVDHPLWVVFVLCCASSRAGCVSYGLFKEKFLPGNDQRRSEHVVRSCKCQYSFLLCLLKQLGVFTEKTATKSMVIFVSRFGNSISQIVHTVFYCVNIILVTCLITVVIKYKQNTVKHSFITINAFY